MTNDERLRIRPSTAEVLLLRPSSLIDTHCHLDLPHFDGDRAEVIERAQAAGVGAIINPAIDLDSCRRVLALADAHPGVYAAVGVHPNDCAGFDGETVAVLRDLAQHEKVVAVGEIGLDYYWERVPHEQQKAALRAQLALASRLGLPVILHCRNAQGGDRACSADLLAEVARWCKQEPSGAQGAREFFGVWHAFSGTLAETQVAYDLGLVLALGGPVTFQNARTLQALALQLEPGRLMLETDAPYLAPHPHRGQRNEPGYLPLVADKLAQLRGVTADVIAQETTAAAVRCFGSIIVSRKQ
jgi:TatD DNase family protein